MKTVLSPGDVLVTPYKKVFGLSHYSIFEGKCNKGIDWAIHNVPDAGVCRIKLDFLLENGLERIDPFDGSEQDRFRILHKAKNLIGTQYDLLKFNCEHFAKYCQSGIARSNQVDSVKLILKFICFFITVWIIDKLLIKLNNNGKQFSR